MKKFGLILSVLACLILSACGDNSEFRIAGTIKGIGTQNIYIVYCADDAIKTQSSTVLDGKFAIVGNSSLPTIVELYSSDKILLGMLFVKNGETVECVFDKTNRYKVSMEGNDVSSQWGKFLTENAELFASGDVDSRNRVIGDYVKKNPNKMLSTILMLTEFYTPENELLADSLLSSISIEARPLYIVNGYSTMLAHLNSETAHGKVRPINLYSKGDSLISYNPSTSSYSILCFTTSNNSSRDTIVPRLKELYKEHEKQRLVIMDVSFASDTVLWKRTIKNDSAQWNQCWALGSVQAKSIDRLAIPRVPYFIVVDSTGQQIYRGSSITHAKTTLDSSLLQK